MDKILTVSVAAYNVEKYITKALEVFTDDAYKDKIEVFVIDDGGNDNSFMIAEQFHKRYPDIIIPVHKENGGWGSTVNYGIEHASGKYFKILDGDDFFDARSFSQYISFLENHESDVVFSPHNIFEDGSNVIVNTITYPVDYLPGNIYPIEEMCEEFPIYLHGMTFKTKILKENKIKIIEHCFYTDIEFVFSTFCLTNSFCISPQILYQYRISRRGQSVSVKGYKTHYLEHLKVTEHILEMYQSVNLSGIKDVLIKKMICYSIGAQYRIFFLLRPNKSNKNLIRKFDDLIKLKYTTFYDTVPTYVKMFRLTHFSPLCVIVALRYVLHYLNKLRKGQ